MALIKLGFITLLAAETFVFFVEKFNSIFFFFCCRQHQLCAACGEQMNVVNDDAENQDPDLEMDGRSQILCGIAENSSQMLCGPILEEEEKEGRSTLLDPLPSSPASLESDDVCEADFFFQGLFEGSIDDFLDEE